MKTLIILLSFLLVPLAFADEWKAEVTRVDKQADLIVVSFSVYRNGEFVHGSAIQTSVDSDCEECIEGGIEEYLHQLAFDSNQIGEVENLSEKLEIFRVIKGKVIIVDSDILDIQKIPSERGRIKAEEKEAERQAQWEADAPKRLKKEQDRQSGKNKLKAGEPLSNDEIKALFE